MKTVVIGGKIVAKVSIIVPIFNASDYLGRCVVFSVTIIVRVLLRVFDRITGLNPVQVESSSSSIRGGKGEALPGGQRAATLHQDKASIPNTTHYDRSMVRRFCQRVQS